MKSAWELALERTGGKLSEISDDVKKSIATIEAKYKSKIAESEISAQNKLNKEKDLAKIEEIKSGLVVEIASFKDKCEREKASVRKG